MKTKTEIYLDNAATTTTDTEIVQLMLPYFNSAYGNPSSIYSSGRNSHVVMEESREKIAKILDVDREEIIFTGSGTEANNLAVLGFARANRKYGNHILISSIEHKSIIESAKQLEREGFDVEYIKVDKYGMIDVEDCISRIKDETILISVMYANNEIGTIQPIEELGRRIKEIKNLKQETRNYPIFHTDACQAVGYLPINVPKIGVDMMTVNGSKIYGPKGIGFLYKNKNINVEPIIFGGGQEHGFRSGTENLPYIVGFGEALLRVEKRREEESLRVAKLRDYFIDELQRAIPDMVLNGHTTLRLPNNIHISVPLVEGESVVLMLDELGIQVSTGSACSANDLQVSHVLMAINQDASLMHGSIRISLGEKTSKEDCDYVISVLPQIILKLRSISPSINLL